MLKVSKGKRQKPRRMFVYGPPGVGKSTFASQAPDCVFLPIEDGLNDIDCVRTEQIQSWPDFLNIMRELMNEEHKFKWVAVDSVDWLEKLISTTFAKRTALKALPIFPTATATKCSTSTGKK